LHHPQLSGIGATTAIDQKIYGGSTH
jgi:hypothetical protein